MRKFWTILAAAVLAVAFSAEAQVRLRKSVANGPMYPAAREDILKALERFYGGVSRTPPQEKLLAMVVPHSAWGFCGQVAAAAFKELEIGQYERVIVLAPSHGQRFEGLSLPAVEGFSTPLGLIPLEGPVVGKLSYSAQFSLRGLNYDKPGRVQLHESEHSIENILPFLLERLGPFYLIPVLVGDLTDAGGRLDPARVEAAAETLREVIDEKTLVVVSTDFTHYGNDFSFRPFNKNLEENIKALDEEAMRLVMARDVDGFIAYLKQTKNPICGQIPLLLLMKLLPARARGEVLDYTQSHLKTKSPNRSVSYAAINFYDPAAPPRPAQVAPVAAGGSEGAPAPPAAPAPGGD